MESQRIHAALTITLALVIAGILSGTANAAPAWRNDTVLSGLGQIENLEPDGHGGFYLSDAGRGIIYDRDVAGRLRIVRSGLAGPAGLQLVGNTLYFVTANSNQLWQLDIRTGRAGVLATVPEPNGLLALPNGDLLISRVGVPPSRTPTGITRYRPSSRTTIPNWSPIPRSNGLALSADQRSVYTDDSLTSQILRIPLDDPAHPIVVTRLPGLATAPDDMTVGRDGALYVAAHLTGEIYRVDLRSGAGVPIAHGISFGWTGPTSIRQARDGSFYVSAFDGTVHRLYR